MNRATRYTLSTHPTHLDRIAQANKENRRSTIVFYHLLRSLHPRPVFADPAIGESAAIDSPVREES